MNPAVQIALLLKVLGRVAGRKKFQKLVHILQHLGYPFSERFEYSYYGMYSQELRGELDALASDDLIAEEQDTTYGGQPTFTYLPTEKLDPLLDELKLAGEVPVWAKMAKHLNRFEAQVLEGISTIFFLQKLGVSGDQLKAKFASLKPHLVYEFEFCQKQIEILDRPLA